MRDAIEAVGAEVFYLPPYFPDLNPIQLAFAKHKARLRQAAERILDALLGRPGQLLDEFTPAECTYYFCHYRHHLCSDMRQ